MTLPHIPDPMPGDAVAADALPIVIIPRIRDIGGFEVRRALPSAQRQMVGPFIFFDQFGPITMQVGQGQDVRPHPHIGLSTVTWLFDGVMYHRDSLGSEQQIAPGELNWMTAGKGIVHSERTPAEERARPHQIFGIQSWVALPKQHEETGLPLSMLPWRTCRCFLIMAVRCGLLRAPCMARPRRSKPIRTCSMRM